MDWVFNATLDLSPQKVSTAFIKTNCIFCGFGFCGIDFFIPLSMIFVYINTEPSFSLHLLKYLKYGK